MQSYFGILEILVILQVLELIVFLNNFECRIFPKVYTDIMKSYG